MDWLAGLASIRNFAIIAGLFFTAFAVQSFRIKIKTNKIEKQQIEINRLYTALNSAVTANKTNQTTIGELSLANQQCALGKEIIASNSKLELTRQQGRIAVIQIKYDKLRNQPPQIGCYSELIDSNLVDRLRED